MNILKTGLLMTGLMALFLFVGNLVGGREGMQVCVSVRLRDESLFLLVFRQNGLGHVSRQRSARNR